MSDNSYDTLDESPNVYENLPDVATKGATISLGPDNFDAAALYRAQRLQQPSNLPSMFSSGYGPGVNPSDSPDFALTKALATAGNEGVKTAGRELDTAGKFIYESGVNAFENLINKYPHPVDYSAAADVPTEDVISKMPAAERALVSGGKGLIESAPRMAIAAVNPVAGALAFGATAEGFDPKQAAIAYALPIIGKYTGAITEAIAAKAGVSSDVALGAFNKIGGASGAAAAIGADQIAEIMKLPEGQRAGAIADAVGNIGSMFLLGTLGERHKPGEKPTTLNETTPKTTPANAAAETASPIAEKSPNEAAGQASLGAAPEKASAKVDVTPEAQDLIKKVSAGERVTNDNSIKTGLALKSVADLDALAKATEGARAEIDAAKAITDPAKKMEAMIGLMSKNPQFFRESVEMATNTGGWIEGEGSIAKKYGERPLDWKNNPEVADWLRKNGEKLGITLPDELKATNPAIDPTAKSSQVSSKLTGGPVVEPAKPAPLKMETTRGGNLNLKPAIQTGTGEIVQGPHNEVHDKLTPEQYKGSTRGYVTPDGKFVKSLTDAVRYYDELKKSKASPEIIGMGGATPSELPQTGGADITGIAQRVREKVAAAGQEDLPPTGKGIAPEASVQQGNDLLAAGADPEKIMGQFESTGRSSSHDMAVGRAQLTKLAEAARRIEEKSGTDSPEYKAAFKARSDWAARTKKMQTEWAKTGAAQQGEVDIDTGSFTGLESEFKDSTGKDFTPGQADTAKRIAKGVKKAKTEESKAKSDLITGIEKEIAANDSISKAERNAKAAADKAVIYARTQLVNAEIKQRVLQASQAQETRNVQEAAKAAAQKAVDKNAIYRTTKMAKAETDARVRAAAKATADAQAEVAAAQKALKKAQQESIANTVKMARQVTKDRIARADTKTYVWTKTREYIEKGITNFDDIRNKLATDLGFSVDKITKALAQSKNMKRLTDEMWRKQQAARRVDQQAKLWVKEAAVPALSKALASVPKILFSLKVGFHGTVALGTHAPMVAFQPRFWNTYVRDFGKMYKMVGSPAYYEMQIQDLLRRPNYTAARRAGLINDPFHYEDYNSPDTSKYLAGLTGMGNRGYSVLKILRQDMFDQHWNNLPKTAQIPEVAAAIADGLNHATGVVKVQAPKGANVALFAPRLEMSRVAWLATDPIRAAKTFSNWKNASEGEKYFAVNQIKEKAWVVGTMMGMLALNQGFLSATGSDQKINFGDPMHSDWLKFKAAGMNLSYGNAMISMARLPARLYQIRQGDGGKLKNLIYPDEDTYSVLGEYARSQLSPFASLATTLWLKGDWQNRPLPSSDRPVPKRLRAQGVKPYTWAEFFTEQVLPIPAEEAAREVWRNGLGMSDEQIKAARKALATIAVMSATGARLVDDVGPKKAAAAPTSSNPYDHL